MRTVRLSSYLVFVVIFLGVALAEDRPPQESGLVETVESRLVLLDVYLDEAFDGEFAAQREQLGISDFEVLINGRPWPLVSVDNACACGVDATLAGPGSPGVVTGRTDTVEAPLTDRPALSTDEMKRFVLYLDFSLLQMEGRGHAIDAAQRWVHDAKEDEDLAMLVAFARPTGMQVVQEFTSDREQLESALNALRGDPEWVDSFAIARERRIEECVRCLLDCDRLCPGTPESQCPTGCCASECLSNAIMEEQQGRASMRALQLLLSTLRNTPGAKTMLYFHQNGALKPASFFGIGERHSSDLLRDMEKTSSVATSSRTQIYPVFSGGMTSRGGGGAVNFSANIADGTGGDYNRALGDLDSLAARAGRRCCRYTLGFEPPPRLDGKSMQVRVRVRGETLPRLYRAMLPTARDRWHQRVQALLLDRTNDGELEVTTELVPLGWESRRWKAVLLVSLQGEDLLWLPGSEKSRAEWGVGAWLASEDGSEGDEFERFAAADLPLDSVGAPALLHRQLVELEEGRYRISAYGGDVTAELFGGAYRAVEVPDHRRGGAFGPVFLSRSPRVVLLSMNQRDEDEEIGSVLRTEPSLVPRGKDPIKAGEVTVVRTMICSREGAPEAGKIYSYLTRAGEPLFRTGPSYFQVTNDCVVLDDELELGVFLPEGGRYDYVVQWTDPGTDQTRRVSREFVVEPRAVEGQEVEPPGLP